MLKGAFNAAMALHSRAGQLKRGGSPDIYSPCRLGPSNYFRFLSGPDTTVIRGREFIIPIDSMLGQFSQLITFEEAPASGTFKLNYNSNATGNLNWNDSASTIQTALRLLPGLSNVLVTGSIAAGLTVVFAGFSTEPLIISASDTGTLEDSNTDPVTVTVTKSYQVWSERIRRSDKIIDSVYGILTIDEVVEMVDLGGAVMAFRCRCE